MYLICLCSLPAQKAKCNPIRYSKVSTSLFEPAQVPYALIRVIGEIDI